MKLIHITDIHYTGKRLKRRLDNYSESLNEKMNEVFRECYKLNAGMIITGDINDEPTTKPEACGDFFANLASMRDRKLPVFAVLGNHDIIGYNWQSYKYTFLYVLAEAGLITLLGETPIEYGKFILTGVHSHRLMDKRLDDYLPAVAKKRPDQVHIHAVHGFLTPEPWPSMVDHILIRDIAHTNADITLTGHEHGGFGIIKQGDKLFVNPSAISRLSAGYVDYGRTPRYAIIEHFPEREAHTVELHNIRCAKPSELILDREALLQEKEWKAKVESFVDEVRASVDLAGGGNNSYMEFINAALKDKGNPQIRMLVEAYLLRAEKLIRTGGEIE
jgi:exonuclease SbcD